MTYFADNFERADTAPGFLGTAPTGQTWQLTGPGFTVARIQSGRMVCPNSNVYAFTDFADIPVRLEGKVSFVGTPGTGSEPTHTLIASPFSSIIQTMLHIATTHVGWFAQVRVAGGSFDFIAGGTYATPLATDGTVYDFAWQWDGANGVDIFLPDGTVGHGTDVRLKDVIGRWLTYQILEDAASTLHGRWESVAAYSEYTAPVVPGVEEPYGDIELDLIDNEPPGLFPADQLSVWGQVRKTWADYMQVNLSNPLDQWYLNLDPRTTSIDDMPEWEYELGIPASPAVAEARRRAFILMRLEKGPFTKARRRRVVEAFIEQTFGQATDFTLDGVPIGSPGITLYSGLTSLEGTYRIYEDVPNYCYYVNVLNSIPVDGLTRELRRITPAGITFTVDNTSAQILNYGRAVKNLGILSYWRMGGNVDSGPYGYTLTPTGTPGVMAAPGLLPGTLPDANPASTFNGTSQFFSVASTPAIDKVQRFAVGAKVRATATQAGGYNMVFSDGSDNFLGVTAGNRPIFAVQLDGVRQTLNGPPTFALNTTYSLLGSWDGSYLRIYVDGLEVANMPYTGAGHMAMSATKYIGIWNFGNFPWQGTLDEVFTMDRAPSADEVLELHRTSLVTAGSSNVYDSTTYGGGTYG
jgi:hypothetical protein